MLLRATCVALVVLTGCRSSTPASPPPASATTKSALTATEEAVLRPGSGQNGDVAGTSVALSADGTLALLGAPFDEAGQFTDEGTVRVFARTAGAWVEQPLLRAPNGAASDLFGFSVALSADGTRAVVGVPYDDTTRGADTGSARVFVRQAGGWTQEAELLPSTAAAQDLTGVVVALSPDALRAFVAAPGFDGKSNPNVGAVHVFLRTAGGWTEEATLVGGNVVGGEQMGLSLAVDGTGTVVAAGAKTEATTAGAGAGTVRVFERGGTGWAQQQTLEAAGAAAQDAFGAAVALSADGTQALVGATGDDTSAGTNSGSVRWFRRTALGAAWTEQATLLPPTAAETPGFGGALALRADGLRAVVGSPTAASNAGAVRVFTSSGTAWVADPLLAFSGQASGNLFGLSVALATHGATVLVGAPSFDHSTFTDNGAAVVYSLDALATGGACTSNGQCTSGACVDGFCCESACGAGGPTCLGCAQARTGRPNGTCGPLVSGTACRATRGACDRTEVCDGVSGVCPGDELLGAGVLCRSRAGVCDAEELCTGNTPDCPVDRFLPTTSQCRSSSGPCDETDFCTGTGPECPQLYKAAGFVCNPSTGDSCDAPDVCSGSSAECRPNFLVNVECRPSAGPCDLAEYCVWGPSCPADRVISAGVVCRSSRGYGCDPAESCDGVAATCPADVNNCPDGGFGCPACASCPSCPACPEPTPQAARGCGATGEGAPDWATGLGLFTALLLLRRARAGESP